MTEIDFLISPLALLKASGGKIVGRTRFQKLIFLAQQDSDYLVRNYEYIAWDFGPYAKELQQSLNGLVDLGFIAELESQSKDSTHKFYEYVLTPEGQTLVEQWIKDNPEWGVASKVLSRLCQRWSEESTRELIRFVYDEFPDFAKRSKYEF